MHVRVHSSDIHLHILRFNNSIVSKFTEATLYNKTLTVLATSVWQILYHQIEVSVSNSSPEDLLYTHKYCINNKSNLTIMEQHYSIIRANNIKANFTAQLSKGTAVKSQIRRRRGGSRMNEGKKEKESSTPSGDGSRDASGSQEVLSTTCVQLLVARL